ncbi:sugar-transfer associated ATP-grasp domain-containing protein [Butyricimonas sp.]|uniref:sugar-transfer associated ATP-grasp domain-containing protein n=1 Tax=Butyricimonas sp. TaxID=1969738 RepID=UPI0025BF4789|nr:sugar-transfer associated ATP-grasp domain-containing protein [Butyricimonas sp.]
MQETFFEKFQRLYRSVKENILPDANLGESIRIIWDFLWEKLIYDVELIDYVQYRFYYKKRIERNRFVTHGKLLKIMKVCNDPKSRVFFDQKPLFNREFKDYLGRDWLDVKDCSKEIFYSFCKRNSVLFCKSPDGMFGKGIEFVRTADVNNLDLFYDRCKKDKLLLEEVLEQDGELAAFNSSAVNTLRLVTLICADDSVRIMAAVLRLSRKGKFADNFHHNGIASLIDIETGIVNTVGVDRKWNRYTVHPDSRKPIVGFQIPKWTEIIDTVKKAARVHPEVRYVGWDVTIKSNGEIVLIEGNPGADPDVTQVEDQIGKWPLYESLLNDIEKVKF